MDLYTEQKVSPAGKVNEKDLKRVLRNMVVFLAPLGVVYLMQINATLQNGTLGFNDLIPTPGTWGAIQLYVINALMDLLRKFTNSKE